MIYKERDEREHPDTGKLAKAGAEAERQMAFYLRRAFVDSKDIHVFNDLRLTDEAGDAAQIDHLVMHRHGFIIIESKSVSGRIAVNERGEFSRYWNGGFKGMPSPVQQARNQAIFLKRLLNANAELLLSKALGVLQARFGYCPFEIIVAVSDKGIIERKTEIPELLKADQVADRVNEIYRRHKKAASPFSIKGLIPTNTDGIYCFRDDEFYRMRRFLEQHHQPALPSPDRDQPPSFSADIVREEPETYELNQPPSDATRMDPAPTLGQCSRCGMQSIIKWGRYGYYWKCVHCDNNMPIKEYCPVCRRKMKLRKDGMRFYKRCESCGVEELYCVFEEAAD